MSRKQIHVKEGKINLILKNNTNNYRNIIIQEQPTEEELVEMQLKLLADKIDETEMESVIRFIRQSKKHSKNSTTLQPLPIIMKIGDSFVGKILVWNGSDSTFNLESMPFRILNKDAEVILSDTFKIKGKIEPNSFGILYVIIDEEIDINNANLSY